MLELHPVSPDDSHAGSFGARKTAVDRCSELGAVRDLGLSFTFSNEPSVFHATERTWVHRTSLTGGERDLAFEEYVAAAPPEKVATWRRLKDRARSP
jgi:hypothetical protein